MSPANLETVEVFMARALHDPVKGYYARNIRSIGQRGDFTTAPQLSEAPAKAIASWAAGSLAATKTRHLIEIGPGLGTLSTQVLRHLPFWVRSRTRFHLVESSPTLSAHQRALLGDKVSHHTEISEALSACSGEAVIFSNELVDAFPVRVFRKTGEWQEVALDRSTSPPSEAQLPAASLPSSSAFSMNYPDGQTVEVHDSYRLWLESWLPFWKRGAMLTIDYGDQAANLYARRPRGTLRAYLLHQRLTGPCVFANEGLQDITADVNFTDLVEWSKPWLASDPILPFSEFIRPYCGKGESQMLEASGHFMALIQSPRR